MATTYLSPGVYIEEVDKGTKPIQGVPTSIAAFVGFTEKAEKLSEDGYTTESILSQAQMVTNWGQFQQHFGGLIEDAYLPHSVRGFFDNGGSICHIISVRTLGAPLPAQGLIPLAQGGEPGFVVHASEGGPSGKKLSVKIENAPTSSGGGSTPAAPKSGGTKKEKEEAAAKEGDKDDTKGSSTPSSSASFAAAGDSKESAKYKVSVLRDGRQIEEKTLAVDDFPAWAGHEREAADAHQFENVKIWTLTGKTTKVAERQPALDTYTLEGGAAQLDLDLLPASAENALVSSNAEKVNDVFKANSVALFQGDSPKRKGIDALEAVDNVNLICAPDVMLSHQKGLIDDEQLRSIQQAMLDHCRLMDYRFAILDAPHNKKTAQDILDWRMNEAGYDSMHGALYYPWVKISDPVTGRSKFLPPSGFIAGIYARSDNERGVHKAPANEVVAGTIDVETNVTKGEQDLLNPVGINCIRKFPGRGIRVWGARTLSSDPSWRYINVRRLFNYVEESVELSTQWIVFEPNDHALWAKVRRDITAFLRTVWLSGALFGKTPEQSFYVKCDEETNLPELRDLGQMVCEIGMAPVKPAEFVIFRFSQWADQADS